MLRFNDVVASGNIRITDDGYLVGEAHVARSGIQLYRGSEVGRPDLNIVRVYRPPEEVFARDAMKSYAYRPVTLDHPEEPVSVDNWRDVAAGSTGAEVVRDGELVRVPMVLMDKKAIDAFGRGVRELSMGYDAEIEWRDGTTPDGEQYDAVQRNLKMNHLALVARARGGDQLRLGDDDLKPKPNEEAAMPDIKTRTITVDGLSVETTDAGAQAIERLQSDNAKVSKELADAQTAHAEAIKAKDTELAKKDAEIDDLKKKVLDEAELDRRVQARADLIANARKVHDADYAGKSDADIRKTVVAAKVGDEAIKDKSPEYIEARFDTLVEAAANVRTRDSVIGDRGTPPNGKPTLDSQEKYEQGLTQAWKTGGVAKQ